MQERAPPFWSNNGLAPTLWGWQPPLGAPGSDTGFCCFCSSIFLKKIKTVWQSVCPGKKFKQSTLLPSGLWQNCSMSLIMLLISLMSLIMPLPSKCH